ncbi:hypothetical protein FRC12_003102 [Ceratobasidium sp. 428]|nr:hypothetical protein FRC12_003102 [Ceratobasidium sp. 428]
MKAVRANLATTDKEGIAAQDQYDDLYVELSASEVEYEESLVEIQEESGSETEVQSDFKSPSDVLSATASSEQPVTECEESQDVSEGNPIGQVNSGLVVTLYNAFTTTFGTTIPSHKRYSKHIKLHDARLRKADRYAIEGEKIILRRVMSRPPGTAWMGTTASIIQGRIGNYGKPFDITFDSGSDITLISLAKYNSLYPKPSKKKGRGIKIVQVTGKSFVNNFIIVPLLFDTPLGPVEMLVEAYIVNQMSTGFILGNDFGNQYQLSLLREPEGSYIGFGSTGRRIAISSSSLDPQVDTAGNKFAVVCRSTTSHLEKRDSKRKRHKEAKALKATPQGSIPVRIYDTKTIPPESILTIQVKTTFELGDSKGFVERHMGSNRTEGDLFGITDCIIQAKNPKLQVANFSKIPIKLHAGQIIGYMFPISQLSKKNSLSKEQLQECESKVRLIQSLDKKEPTEDDGLDMSYSEPPQGGPKIWDNPGPDPVPEDRLMAELNFNPSLTPEERIKLENIIKKHKDAFGLDGRLGSHEARVPIKLKDETLPSISMAPYSASPAKREAIDKQMDDWL